ncbi:hypothetical protein CDAR_262621 [Caerostris darwini]|uniref:Reverse transcriptase n=1 Tax=Caerostris darwini TaxID=1538125 RepID=A0AAV4TJ71_9ARAC|nr:hypothetical protein CDAR_262621 [Caerostris darwini]
MNDGQRSTSMTSNTNNYYKSSKSINELVLRLGEKSFEEIHIICQHSDAKLKIPRSNPFLIQADIKKHVNRHDHVTNMKFSRQGKLIFSTADPVCAAQILNLDKILETPISTAVTFENITERFLIFDIPTNLPLSELAAEIMHTNDMEVVELRRFVKLNSTQEFSPVLITILGIFLPDSIKIWFTNQKIRQFVDRVRQCLHCYEFTHATRVCDRNICPRCGVNHEGLCQGPEKCVHCAGSHPATSKICPRHIHEQKLLEFKCRNHLTIGEARRIYAHSSKTNYSDAAKTNTTAPNIEEIVNQRVESIVQNITIKMEQQTTLLIEIFQKTIENLVQYLVSVFHQTDLKKSPNRKRQMINLVPPTNNPMQWDAGGSNASD